jgi:putative endopeptidase
MVRVHPPVRIAVVALLLLAGSSTSGQVVQPPVHRAGLNPADMDPSCTACDNFYRFANGGWLDRNPVPADRSEWSSYDEVSDRTRAELRSILEGAVAAARLGDTSSEQGKLGRFYGACLNEGATTAQGIRPITPTLARIAGITDRAGVQRELTRLQLMGVEVPFAFAAGVDSQNSEMMIADVWQAGTTYGDISRYLGDDAQAQSYRTRLRDHIAQMLELAGVPAAAVRIDADRVISIETALARQSMTPVQMRDPRAVTNRLTLSELQALTPHWNWNSYFTAAAVDLPTVIQVGQPDFLRELNRLLAERSLDDWKAYLRWHLVNARAQWLSPELAQADFAFSASLSGARAQRPRWSRCMTAADQQLGEILGKAYLERVFTPQARARAMAMIANLKAVMGERLRSLEWMSPATRREALAKLESMKTEVGGPTKWTDYGALHLEGESFVEMLDSATAFGIRERNKRIGKPVDKERWSTLPQRISGAYSSAHNRVTYPAAKFQPPFFDPLADDATNYGAIGATLGHEIVHGFDDHGRQYDAAGNLRDWWEPEDAARFNERANRLVAQFDAFSVNGEPVNGRLSLGENVADLGGLTISYYALQRALRGQRRERINGFTPEQRFFLSWARNWRANSRPEILSRKLRVGPHAPEHLRVIAPLSNMAEFAAAFGCKAGDQMFRPPAERVRIW